MKRQIPLKSSTSQWSRTYFGILSPLQCTVWNELRPRRKLNPHQLQLSMLYLFAFSRTERVRKLIQIPSLLPKIHSRIPAHEQTVRGNPPLWTCTQAAPAHRCNLRPGWSARSWSEWRFAARQRRNIYTFTKNQNREGSQPTTTTRSSGCNRKWRTGLIPVSMPTYPAKFVDLKTVWFFLLKSRFTTRGLSFSVMIHDLFFKSHLRRTDRSGDVLTKP